MKMLGTPSERVSVHHATGWEMCSYSPYIESPGGR